jgi:hypothetical protein
MPTTKKSPPAARPRDSQGSTAAAEPRLPDGHSKHPAGTPSPEDPATSARIDAIFALRAPYAAWKDALDEWLWRKAAAAERVRRREWSENDAAAALKPWLAVACLCGLDLPELHEGLERLRTYDRATGEGVTEAQARLLLADEICVEADWRAELARAFTRANDRLRGEYTEADADRTRRLMRLIGALGGKLPPVPFPVPDQQQEAA